MIILIIYCLDICTNKNGTFDEFVYDELNPFSYCQCERTADNRLSYILQCFQCPTGLRYNPNIKACALSITLQCVAGKSRIFCYMHQE